MQKDIYAVIRERFKNETDLTLQMMRRVVSEWAVTDPYYLDDIYGSVIYFTGDWPEHQGWQSSDTAWLLKCAGESLNIQQRFNETYN